MYSDIPQISKNGLDGRTTARRTVRKEEIVMKMDDEMRKNEVKRVITCKMEDIASLVVNSGYTVTIRPTKDGAKITSHKEKIVK